jgi:hypothetical protein
MTINNEKGSSGRKWAQPTLQVSSQDIPGKPEEDNTNLSQDNVSTWGSEVGYQPNVSSDMLLMFNLTQYMKDNYSGKQCCYQ